LSSAHDNVVKPSVAVITGASQGIGAAIARHFAGIGYAVVVNYHKSPEAAEALCADITEAGGSAKAFHADITDEAQAAALIDFAVTGFGGLSVLSTMPASRKACRSQRSRRRISTPPSP